jgi:hypothetical protein
MVFFTCVIVVLVLYFLQEGGLIFVTIIAVIAELINLFMTQTLTKSVEKQINKKFVKIINGYKVKITAQKKTIKEFQNLQEESIKKLYNANVKIKEYENSSKDKKKSDVDNAGTEKTQEFEKRQGTETLEILEEKKSKPEEFIDLPSGSNRKKLPI